MAHWAKIMADDAIMIKIILFTGQIAGHILSHGWFGQLEISYWIGKEYWGKGIATKALTVFLGQQKVRPFVCPRGQR